MFRIQFTITNEELEQLEKASEAAGCPNVSEYAKEKTLGGPTTYGELYRDVIRKIETLEPGTEFHLRDLTNTPPPALLGRWLYAAVENGQLSQVQNVESSNAADPARYKKK
jgi:hypothetical protein